MRCRRPAIYRENEPKLFGETQAMLLPPVLLVGSKESVTGKWLNEGIFTLRFV